ncbi:NADH/ubiquinone/plastoquinone (complex I) [candidate division WOR-3 bacterium]|uniref:NADH/ubiquinone/plastoquinone (Complex I) n=1 Tax=candidate division WOR-3 bacterium TaxID=2052148 RepID=A0A937XFI6_UNCW3|nr:NADH/ubiquinone/plastoquinone (complex I) [candidate division WOR-3 bacterium]
MDASILPLFVVIPMATAFLIPLFAKLWQRSSDLIANAAGAALLGISVYGSVRLFGASPALIYRMGGWASTLGITLVYDHLTALAVLAVNAVGLAALLFSVRYLDHYTGRWKFFSLFMLVLAGLNGVAITGDMFNLFVFIEISAVSSYALVAFGTDFDELEAGFKYMVIGEIGGTAILLAIALLYAKASTLNMAVVSQVMAGFGRTPLFWLIVAIFLVGFAVKMAMVPFHAWLPDAHPSAPAPVSALLSGVFIKVLGVYAMCRVMFNVFGLSRDNAPTFFNLLIGFGVLSIVAGGLLAYAQKDYKRLLAYSSVSQIGYILIGLGLGNFWGIVGALFHLLAHAVGKSLLFLTAGSVEHATGTRDLDKLSGLEKSMPVTTWSHLFGSLSLAGLPPFAGFFSKLFIIVGALSARMYWLAILAALFSTVTLGYLVNVVNRAFFTHRDRESTPAREVPATMLIAMLGLVVLTLALGIGFKPVLDRLVGPAANVLLQGIGYAQGVLGR